MSSSANYDDSVWDESGTNSQESYSNSYYYKKNQDQKWRGSSDGRDRRGRPDNSGWRNSGNERSDNVRGQNDSTRGRNFRGRDSANTGWKRRQENYEKPNTAGKYRNDYWQHDDRSDGQRTRGNYVQQDRSISDDWIESCEFTNSSRQFNSNDSRQRNTERKGMQDIHNGLSMLTIRSTDVGKVIGKGGSKIRELEEESGARIHVIPHDNQPETTVELRGTDDVQKKAKQLIEEFLANFSDRPRPENSRNWSSGSTNSRRFETEDSSKSVSLPSEPREIPKIDWAAIAAYSLQEKEKKWAAMPAIKKHFYFEDPEVSNMSHQEVIEFRCKNNNIVVSKLSDEDTRRVPNPVKTFDQAFNHYPEILEEIRKQGFQEPSPIQCQSWPILLQGYDMIGIAQTGTGKTIAFLLPAMIHIDSQVTPREERVGPTCLVLAPTRELAQQIEQETKKYKYRGIKCVCVYGGGNRREQISIVTKGVEIVIATPGRLNDLLMNNIIDVSSVTYLVLDEADRMLDMGFEPQIKKILLDIRPDRQTVMTSATWPEGVRRLASQYMDKPFQVFIGTLDLAAVHSVTQHVKIVADEEKRETLYDFIENMDPQDKVIIFVDKKIVADDLSSDLVLNGIDCQSIHGDREQCDREQALDDLKTGRVRILVATDVASRGLDIKDITHIFNYDFPRNAEEYVHRVGRTGRAGRTGESLTLVTRGDWKQARQLIEILSEAGQDVPQELYDMAERYQAWKQKKDAEDAACRGGRFKSGRRGGRGRRDWDY